MLLHILYLSIWVYSVSMTGVMEKKCSRDLILHSVKFVHDKVIAQPLPMSTLWVRLTDTDLTKDKGYVLQNLWKDKLMPG